MLSSQTYILSYSRFQSSITHFLTPQHTHTHTHMATLSESNTNLMIDEVYEFSAPRFFDFIQGETKEEMQRAELWFETTLSHAPSRKLISLLFITVSTSTLIYTFCCSDLLYFT